MAAVTVDSRLDPVFGNLRAIVAQVDIATSGDTWVTGLATIYYAGSNDVAITLLAVSGGTVTFTTTGAVANAKVFVIGL